MFYSVYSRDREQNVWLGHVRTCSSRSCRIGRRDHSTRGWYGNYSSLRGNLYPIFELSIASLINIAFLLRRSYFCLRHFHTVFKAKETNNYLHHRLTSMFILSFCMHWVGWCWLKWLFHGRMPFVTPTLSTVLLIALYRVWQTLPLLPDPNYWWSKSWFSYYNFERLNSPFRSCYYYNSLI